MPDEKFFEHRHFRCRCAHHIHAGAAVHVNVKETWGQDGVAEIDDPGVRRHVLLGAGCYLRNAPVCGDEKRVVNLLNGSEQTSCSEYSFHEENPRQYRICMTRFAQYRSSRAPDGVTRRSRSGPCVGDRRMLRALRGVASML